MKIKLFLKDKRPCYVAKCPGCKSLLEIDELDIKTGWTYCRCLDDNGKLNKIELEEE